MTKVTTITEYTEEGAEGTVKVVNGYNDLGFSGTVRIGKDSAELHMRYPGNEGAEDIWNIHPVDAMTDFMAQFFEY